MSVAHIILACANEPVREKMIGLLASAGFPVFRAVGSAGEVRRALHLYGDSIVLVCGRLPDSTPDQLSQDLGERSVMMILGRASWLMQCEDPRLFRLELPSTPEKISGAVLVLRQIFEMKLPRRQGEDKAVVDRAKEHLEREYGWTEPEAHRWLQRMAMERRLKMTECAALILSDGREEG